MPKGERDMNKKVFPKVGDHLYLNQFTGDYYVDMVRKPYTVVAVTNQVVTVRACKLTFPIFHYDPNTMSDYYKQFDGQRVRFFDSLPEKIEDNPDGATKNLYWHPKRGLWGTKGEDSSYPEYAIFGDWEYYPYLN